MLPWTFQAWPWQRNVSVTQESTHNKTFLFLFYYFPWEKWQDHFLFGRIAGKVKDDYYQNHFMSQYIVMAEDALGHFLIISSVPPFFHFITHSVSSEHEQTWTKLSADYHIEILALFIIFCKT